MSVNTVQEKECQLLLVYCEITLKFSDTQDVCWEASAQDRVHTYSCPSRTSDSESTRESVLYKPNPKATGDYRNRQNTSMWYYHIVQYQSDPERTL